MPHIQQDNILQYQMLCQVLKDEKKGESITHKTTKVLNLRSVSLPPSEP